VAVTAQGGAVLGIETSCDETAAAVVVAGREIRSNVVAGQAERHAPYGGVVPEIAGRAHVELVGPVVAEALVEGGVPFDGLEAVAACRGPGLAGSLLVGVAAAKALALAGDLPYVAVNHLDAHCEAVWLEEPDLAPPFVVLVASGGHTLLARVDGPGRAQLLGQTYDDAAGEAFDKVARLLGLGYPGGPAIDGLAARGDPTAVRFPRPVADDRLDFSFSGLKTAVALHRRDHPDVPVADVAAAFQEAVVDTLVAKLLAAARAAEVRTVALGGGVAANSRLRLRALEAGDAAGLRVVLPDRALCTDNAAMIAATGFRRLRARGPDPLEGGIDPSAPLGG
jgi:N6-L-threonylcarbamoyladenine synthase